MTSEDNTPAPSEQATPPPSTPDPTPVAETEPFKSPLGFESIRGSGAPDERRIEIRPRPR